MIVTDSKVSSEKPSNCFFERRSLGLLTTGGRLKERARLFLNVPNTKVTVWGGGDHQMMK